MYVSTSDAHTDTQAQLLSARHKQAHVDDTVCDTTKQTRAHTLVETKFNECRRHSSNYFRARRSVFRPFTLLLLQTSQKGTLVVAVVDDFLSLFGQTTQTTAAA